MKNVFFEKNIEKVFVMLKIYFEGKNTFFVNLFRNICILVE